MLLVRFVLWKIFIVFETGLCCFGVVNIKHRYHEEMAVVGSGIGVGVDIGVGVSDSLNVDGYVWCCCWCWCCCQRWISSGDGSAWVKRPREPETSSEDVQTEMPQQSCKLLHI